MSGPAMRVDVVTIFPDYLQPLRLSLLGKAAESGLIGVHVHDLRTFTSDRHRTVDDTPLGGGAGMVMTPGPWADAIDFVLADGRSGPAPEPSQAPAPGARGEQPAPLLIVPSPAGVRLTQPVAADLATRGWLIFACGRYEGIDERVQIDAAERIDVLPVSIGDYVLAGGEAAVLVIVEAVARLIPGVLGNPESIESESHAVATDGLLEYPVYTRPARWRELDAPEVLLSGHHARIAAWRREQSLRRTAERRPDLLEALPPERLRTPDLAVLAELGWHVRRGRLMREPWAGGPAPSVPVAD